MSYEEARAELEATCAPPRAGGATLEESLKLWERGELLARQCQEWLDGARRRLDAVRESASDRPAESAADES